MKKHTKADGKLKRALQLVRRHKALSALIIIAAIAHLTIIIFSGSYLCINHHCGDYYWGVHEHDGIWHLAVTAVSFNKWPFIHPVYSGSMLSGYNLLLDLVMYIASRFGLPPAISYFKVLPVLWFILFSGISLKYARKINPSPAFVWILLFLFYFGTSFSYFINVYHGNFSIMGTGGMLTMQSLLSLTNLQVAFSYVIFIFVLYLLATRRLNLSLAVSLSFFVFLDLGLKFYAGIVLGILVGVFFLTQLVMKRDIKVILYIFILGIFSLLSVVLFYNPFQAARNGLGIFNFTPFAIVHQIVEDPSLLYMRNLVDARYFLQLTGKVSPRLIAIESLTLLLFMVFNLGVRTIGFAYLLIQYVKRRVTPVDISVSVAILFALFFPVLFTQKGEWWNSIQFFYFGSFLLNIYTAKALSKIQNKYILALAILIMVLVSVPSNADVLAGNIPTNGAVYVSKDELHALGYLRKQPDGVVVVPLFNKDLKGKYGKYSPLYSSVDSSYIAAYTGKQVFLANIGQVRLTGIDFSARYKSLETGDCKIIERVDYVYYPVDLHDLFFRKCIENNPFFKVGYSNDRAVVYIKK